MRQTMPAAVQFKMLDRQTTSHCKQRCRAANVGVQCSSIVSQKLAQYDTATTVHIAQWRN